MSAVLFGLAALICLSQVFRSSESAAFRAFVGSLGVIMLYFAIRGLRSATVMVRGDCLVVTNLLRTRTIPASSIDRLIAEVGFVNLYRRVYPRLILKNGTSNRFTQLNRRLSQREKIERWVDELNDALGIKVED